MFFQEVLALNSIRRWQKIECGMTILGLRLKRNLEMEQYTTQMLTPIEAYAKRSVALSSRGQRQHSVHLQHTV